MMLLSHHIAEPEASAAPGRGTTPDVECECMLCDLPMGARHEPVRWRVTVDFPGPYPNPGRSVMLLCTHCTESWLGDDWPEPYDNFVVVGCEPIP